MIETHESFMIYLMFLSREIDIKLCQIYAKNYIYKILYKNRRFKQIIFSKYATNLKTTISQRSLKNLGLDQLLKCLGFRLSFFLYSPWGAYHWNIYLILKGCLILTKIIDCFWTKKCASHFFRELQKWKWLVLQ